MSTPELNKALVAARKKISNPKFDSVNPHFKSKFASLKAIIDAVYPAMLENGITVSQELITVDGGVGCVTHLMHENGEERKFGPFVVMPTKSDPQGYASASTYARRYCLQSVAGVVGDADDDGNAASNGKRKEMPMNQARELAALLDAADPTTGEGCDAFGEAWLELNSDEQLGFGPHFSNFYPGAVSAQKQKMRDVIAVYRNHRNGDSE